MMIQLTASLIAALSALVVALVALWGMYTAVRSRPLDALRKELSTGFDASMELLRTELGTSVTTLEETLKEIKSDESSGRADIVTIRESIARIEASLPHLERRVDRLEQ